MKQNKPQKGVLLRKGVEEEEGFLGNQKTLIPQSLLSLYFHLSIEIAQKIGTQYSEDEKNTNDRIREIKPVIRIWVVKYQPQNLPPFLLQSSSVQSSYFLVQRRGCEIGYLFTPRRRKTRNKTTQIVKENGLTDPSIH